MTIPNVMPTRRLVFLSLLIAMGAALHIVEGVFVIPLPVPGVKLGLANIATVLALSLYGLREGMTVALVRVLLGSLIGGVFLSPAFFLALGGAFLSTLVMGVLMRHTSCFSIIGICVAGAVAHNCGQLAAASFLLQSSSVIYYLPVLLIAAVPTGLFTGYTLQSLLDRLEKNGMLP